MGPIGRQQTARSTQSNKGQYSQRIERAIKVAIITRYLVPGPLTAQSARLTDRASAAATSQMNTI